MQKMKKKEGERERGRESYATMQRQCRKMQSISQEKDPQKKPIITILET